MKLISKLMILGILCSSLLSPDVFYGINQDQINQKNEQTATKESTGEMQELVEPNGVEAEQSSSQQEILTSEEVSMNQADSQQEELLENNSLPTDQPDDTGEETAEATESEAEETKPTVLEARAAQQDEDGYWLVDTTATLTTYLSERKTLLRLTNDLDLGTTGFKLYNGVILDGAGYRITYNKGGGYQVGFYLEENDAEVTMKNVTFGNEDGSGSIGYYGIVTGHSGYTNMSLVYEDVTYKSVNGQPIYNPNGQVVFRGTNQFWQNGTSTYSQEWAETNYIEIQSGTTTIDTQNTLTDRLIYTTLGTAANNNYRNTAQIIVRSGAGLDITTDKAIIYSAAGTDHNFIVEKAGKLTINQLSGTNATRRRFIYPDLNSSANLNFDFAEGSEVQLSLTQSIAAKAANGGVTIGTGASVQLGVASGTVFDITANTSSLFKISIDDAKWVDFSGTGAGTLGLQSSANTINNFSFNSATRMKVTGYTDNTGTTQTGKFGKSAAQLNLRSGTYSSLSGEALTAEELGYLADSRRLVFEKGLVPTILDSQVSAVTDETAELSVTADNHDSAAKEVKYLLFTSLDDTGQLEKARHIENKTDFTSQNTENIFQYNHLITGLNPNTDYWLQAMVTSEIGKSLFSTPVHFTTAPQLSSLTITEITKNSGRVNGSLSSDTGFWTDFQKGEEQPIPNQPATYGGIYQAISVEYSSDSSFSSYQTLTPLISGSKNELFSGELTNLSPETTYYVRLRVLGADGIETVLQAQPITEFTTDQQPEIIDVSIPIDMTFETRNSDLNTGRAGQIYSTENNYEVINRGTVSTKVTVSGFEQKNPAADSLKLLENLNGQAGLDELALILKATGDVEATAFLTPDIAQNPIQLGIIDPIVQQKLHLDFDGKFFNPTRTPLFPDYQLTLKFEKDE